MAMAPKSRGTSLLFDALTKPSLATSKNMCNSCRRTLVQQQRQASTAAAQSSVETPPISQLTPNDPQASPLPQPKILINAGVVVSRPPLTTPDPHTFETAYHLYQRRLNERLVLPFSQYFHFKRGTPSFEHWRAKRRERNGVASRDTGGYNAYTKESWNDEVLVGDECANSNKLMEALVDEEGRATEFVGEDGDVKTAGLKRQTDADKNNDQRSLERSLSRTLYLLVKNKPQGKTAEENSLWRFPAGQVEGKEGLKENAKRILGQSCGVNMNTWFVGNHPVGHFVDKHAEAQNVEVKSTNSTSTKAIEATKTFFMKARIFAGQASLADSQNGVTDYKWLSKEEIEKQVSPEYWQGVKNMLVEQ